MILLIYLSYKINNTDRSVGAILSNEISKKYKDNGLPSNTINVNFKGYAGQSFGAFATSGITFVLEGCCNDYLGKGLSGAKLIIKKPKDADFKAEENIIAGNAIKIPKNEICIWNCRRKICCKKFWRDSSC